MRKKISNEKSFVDEIAENKTAIQMVLDSHQEIEKENKSLKRKIDKLSSNVEKNEEKKKNNQLALVFVTFANISISFAVNFITDDKINTGLILFVPGVILMAMGLYFSLKD